MKTIVITGASGGIGLSIAKTLAKKDNRLILIYNNHNKDLIKFQKDFLGQCESYIYKCNLTNVKEIENIINDVIKKFKRIDVLINCAGIAHFCQIQDLTEKDFYKVVDNNLKSTVMITSKVSKHMIHEQFGKIVNISSMWGVVGSSMESLYSLTKSAINNLTLSLAKELGPSNITVNSICPGLINTKMNKSLSDETINEIVSSTPIKRIGQPEDVANLVDFLIDDKSSFITGQIITVDGGLSL